MHGLKLSTRKDRKTALDGDGNSLCNDDICNHNYVLELDMYGQR